MQKIMNYIKQYIGVISIVLAVCILLSYSLSHFVITTGNNKVAEMYIGELKYTMTIDGESTNTLTIPSGETIIDVDLTNLNEIDTYFKLIYLKNSNISISYYEQTKDTSDVLTKYKSPGDSITKSGNGTIKLKIANNTTTDQTVSFSLSGGYITNELKDVEVPNAYSEIITIETPTSNTYFCKTTDTLAQGLEYIDGEYTYKYRREASMDESTWYSTSTNGWGVQLGNKTNTEPVTSKLCTYINNKPIVSMSYMFYKSNATSIDLSSFNTSYVTNMQYMFAHSQMVTLDLSGFDTSKVTNMRDMFSNSQATTIEISSLNTSNVTNMSGMFFKVQAKSLNLSGFDTGKVTDMSSIFCNCEATSLDLSNFDTSNVIYMNSMFNNSKATEIKGLDNFNTSNVTNMTDMFASSYAHILDLSNFDTSNVTDMSRMFYYGKSTTLKLQSFNTKKVTNMEWMFSGSKATSIDLSNFDTSNVTTMKYMFTSSEATSILGLENFDTSNVTDMLEMFSNSKVKTLDLSSFDTRKITNMNWMFNKCSNLTTIYVSDKFITENVSSSTQMFNGSTKLVGGSGTTYNANHIDKEYAHIDGGTSNPGYFTDVADKNIPKPIAFSTDSWQTIIHAVRKNNISKYNVGDTKEIDLGTTYGKHNVRIANTSTPTECSTTGFSQTACGFVIEFTDIINFSSMNSNGSDNSGGWTIGDAFTFIYKVYNSFPSDLKSGVISTYTVAGYGSRDTSNFTSNEKIFLLAPGEIYKNWSNSNDTARTLTRQLDYYNQKNVTTSSYSSAIKNYNNTSTEWWHRSATNEDGNSFFITYSNGSSGIEYAIESLGISPAFRIG